MAENVARFLLTLIFLTLFSRSLECFFAGFLLGIVKPDFKFTNILSWELKKITYKYER